jgi:hypothetical protein
LHMPPAAGLHQNWEKYRKGEADQSNRDRVLRNQVWATTSEAIDVKKGTTGGLIEGNRFDGSGLLGADSWEDVNGNGYTVRGNIGTNSPQDGYQIHVINDMDWGMDNLVDAKVAEIDAEKASGSTSTIRNYPPTSSSVRTRSPRPHPGSPTSIVRKQPPRDRALLETAVRMVHTLPAGTPLIQLLIH